MSGQYLLKCQVKLSTLIGFELLLLTAILSPDEQFISGYIIYITEINCITTDRKVGRTRISSSIAEKSS
jgi:hypothetical protein